MIFSQATGGLGNQLYNYAIGFSLAKNYNDAFTLDISAYQFSPRPYVLNQLNISGNVRSICPPRKDNKLFRSIARICRIFASNKYGKCKWVKELYETRNQFGHYDFSHKASLYLEGFWQHYRYFDECRDQLCKEFTLKEEFCSSTYTQLVQQCKKENSIAVHIRRGDYEASWILPDIYYHKAFDTINVMFHDPKYYFFCEDITYVKKHYSYLANVVFVTDEYHLTDIEEFFVMSNCKNQIIANSTFSWWAAYLNANDNKIVVAPQFAHWNADYYPDNWLVIPNDK